MCATDWLKVNLRGKTDNFNRYWDHKIDPKEKKVSVAFPPHVM